MANLSKSQKTLIVIEAMDAFMDKKTIKACKYKEGTASYKLWVETYNEIKQESRPPSEIQIPRLHLKEIPDINIYEDNQLHLWDL